MQFCSSAGKASFFLSCTSRGLNRGIGEGGSGGGIGGTDGLISLAETKA